MAFLFKSRKEPNRKPSLDEKAKRYTVRTERLNNNLQALGLDTPTESSWSSRILASPDSIPGIESQRNPESPISQVDRYDQTHNLRSDPIDFSLLYKTQLSPTTEAGESLPHERNQRAMLPSQESVVITSSTHSQSTRQDRSEQVRAINSVPPDRPNFEDFLGNERGGLFALKENGKIKSGHTATADFLKYGPAATSLDRRHQPENSSVKKSWRCGTTENGNAGKDRTNGQSQMAKISWLDVAYEKGPPEEDMVSPRVMDESKKYGTISSPSKLPQKRLPKGSESLATTVATVAALQSKGSKEGYNYVKRSQDHKNSIPEHARVKPKLQIRPVTALVARPARNLNQDFPKPGNTEQVSHSTEDGTSEQMGAGHSDLNVIPILDNDPYIYLSHLGDGGYGVVDKVRRVDEPGKVFARKRIRLKCGRLDRTLQETYREFKILKRLNHEHIINVVEIFRCQNRLFIIMEQVADTDMKEYLECLDGLEDGVERDLLRGRLRKWPGCLIQAIDYLHEMKVKHRDLKPANILIKGDKVLLADFGVSKDLLDEETTTNLYNAGRAGSPMYSAPEMDLRLQTRSTQKGRAVDIYALGCILLEIATALAAPPHSCARFEEFRKTNGLRAYNICHQKVLRWIWYIESHSYRRWIDEKRDLGEQGVSKLFTTGRGCARFAFLMLDWNPKTRITARQLVHLIQLYQGPNSPIDVKERACSACEIGETNKARNIPPHSTFKDLWDMYPKDPEDALKDQSISNWEIAKRQWLSQHMWW
jgi:serine/threonine protein kinase